MSGALRKLRIVAIPLTRPNAISRALPHPTKVKPSRLVYYQFQITRPLLKPPSTTRLASGDQDSTDTKKKGWLPEEGIVKWATNKAVDTWAAYGREKSGWKVCFVHWL
jgi:hypothetical protein